MENLIGVSEAFLSAVKSKEKYDEYIDLLAQIDSKRLYREINSDDKKKLFGSIYIMPFFRLQF